MSSETKIEKELYESIKTVLEGFFASCITESRPMHAPSYERNPHLEITAYGHFSETLKSVFSDEALRFLSVEKNLPDIMGFVQKKPSSPKELITVEVKRTPIRLFHILKAKFYQDIFGAEFGLLISPRGIIEEKVRFVVDTDVGRNIIRGNVIIAKFNKSPYGTVGLLEINPKFRNSVPEPFKRFIKP